VTQFIDVATDAFRKMGVYAPGEPIDDADIEQALNTADVMLDSWSIESLSCFANLTQSVVLQPTVGQYTIGPGGVVNGPRPTRLIMGPGAAYTMDNNGNRYGLEVVPLDKWNLVTSNTLVDANVPIYLYFDSQYPLAFLNFWPIPNINWTAYWTSYLQLTSFSAVSSPFSFPPGYQKAIQDCLAVELWPYYFKGEVPNTLVQFAQTSKGNIKRNNIRENVAVFDQELVSRSNSTYNIYTDDQGSA
jgi:hypothetical protein